jgi:hypothetical protein
MARCAFHPHFRPEAWATPRGVPSKNASDSITTHIFSSKLPYTTLLNNFVTAVHGVSTSPYKREMVHTPTILSGKKKKKYISPAR